ncbi:MAG: DUF2007 domain-containing protein [Thermoanaerobaculia bacterium]
MPAETVNDDAVLIARFVSIPDAEGARSALGASGVEAFLADENMVAMNWLYSNAIGGIRLFVRREDAERAREVLELAPSAESEEEPEAYSAEVTAPAAPIAIRCPDCGSTDVRSIPKVTIVAVAVVIGAVLALTTPFSDLAALIVVIAAGLVLLTPSHKCRQCSRAFTPAEPEEEDELELPAEEGEPEQPCPRCGTLETGRIDWFRTRRLMFVFTAFNLLLWIPLAIAWPFLKKHECTVCGARW